MACIHLLNYNKNIFIMSTVFHVDIVVIYLFSVPGLEESAGLES